MVIELIACPKEKEGLRSSDFAWLLQAGAELLFYMVVRYSLNYNSYLLSLFLSSPRISRFSNVYHLSIHISKNFGADTTKVFYIGLRGEWTELRRHEVTICNYEASANPADHRVHQVTPQTHFIS